MTSLYELKLGNEKLEALLALINEIKDFEKNLTEFDLKAFLDELKREQEAIKYDLPQTLNVLNKLKEQNFEISQKTAYFDALIAKNEQVLIKLSEVLHFGLFFTWNNADGEVMLTSTYKNMQFDYNSHELHLNVDDLNISTNADAQLILTID